MISEAHRVVEVRIPKTASTSTVSLFGSTSPALDNGVLDPAWATDPRVSEYFSFAVVRNPWARFLSAWRYVRTTSRLPLETVLRDLPRPGPWESARDGSARARFAYGASALAADVLRLRDRLTVGLPWAESRRRHDYNYLHVGCSETAFMLGPDGRVAVDAVYPLEDYGRAVEDLRRRFDLGDVRPLHLNVGEPVGDYRELFTPAARELFAAAFPRDVTLLGYDFDAGPDVPPVWNDREGGLRAHIDGLLAAEQA